MTRNIWIGIVVVIVLVAGSWWYLNQSSAPATSEATQLPTTEQTTQQNTTSGTQSAQTNPVPSTSAGIKTYSNSQYGVSLQYPSSVQIDTSPSCSTSDSSDGWWCPFSNDGTGLFSASSQGDVVFIGVSSGVSSSRCTGSGATVLIGGVPFKEGGGGSPKWGGEYVDYRTVHNNMCYEIVRTIGYKATAQNSQLLDAVVQSFRFN